MLPIIILLYLGYITKFDLKINLFDIILELFTGNVGLILAPKYSKTKHVMRRSGAVVIFGMKVII